MNHWRINNSAKRGKWSGFVRRRRSWLEEREIGEKRAAASQSWRWYFEVEHSILIDDSD